MCCLLLEYGADVNIRNDTQETALHFAASNDRQITSLLLRNGAEIQNPIKTYKEVGCSPLGNAIFGSPFKYYNEASFRMLLDYCIRGNIKVTLEPLFEYAIKREIYKCTKIILQRGKSWSLTFTRQHRKE